METKHTYTTEEPQFYSQDLEPINVEDLQKWVDSNELDGLVDEEQGGIIGYINKAHADRIAAQLNQRNELLKALTDIVELKYEAGKSRPYIETILEIANQAIQKATK